MKRFIALLIIGVGVQNFESLQAVHTSVEIIDGVPVVCVNGNPYNMNGWIVLRQMGSETNAEVKARMDSTKAQGFEVVGICFNWSKIESTHNVYKWDRVDDLIDYAASLGLYVILVPEAQVAPAWFADSLYPDAVFYSFDPDSAQHPSQLRGRLAITGQGCFPIFYHPAYYSEVGDYFMAAINRYKNHPALFGWVLGLFYTGEFNYPGGSFYYTWIGGFVDYSDYTKTLYGSTPPYPLNMFSQPLPDTRPEWLDWTEFRIKKKREVLDYFAGLIKDCDSNHIVIGYPFLALMVGNPYDCETFGYDPSYMITHPSVDVLGWGPQVTQFFLQVKYYSIWPYTSTYPYMGDALIEAAHRNGKAVVIHSERGKNDQTPSVDGRITVWAEFFKSLGADLLWWPYHGQWTASEINEIGGTLPISKLSKVRGHSAADFAFVELPFELAKYYTEQNQQLKSSMIQVTGFMDAGLPFDYLIEDEILDNPAILNDYKAIGFLYPSMYNLLAPDSLKQIVTDFENSGGIVWEGKPADGTAYRNSGYKDSTYLDSLRVFYDTNNLARHRYDGYFIYIVGNKPYIFMLSRESDWTGTIEVSIKGWGLPDGDTSFVEYNSGSVYHALISNDMVTLNVNLTKQEPYLFILKPFVSVKERESRPASIALFQNHPNPFNSSTNIRYLIARGGHAGLKIYNLAGQLVKTLVNEEQKAGNYIIKWDGRYENKKLLPSGIYFVKLKVGGAETLKSGSGSASQTRKLLLLSQTQ